MSLSLVEDLEQECLICLKSTLPKQQGDPKYQEEVFNRFLEIFNVNLSPFKWNFTTEGTPFCSNCSYGVSQLIELHEKLEGIQNDIEKEISGIKLKLTVSEKHKKSIHKDVRTIIFRGQVLGSSSAVAAPSSKILYGRTTPQKQNPTPAVGQPLELISKVQEKNVHLQESNNVESAASQGEACPVVYASPSECSVPLLEPCVIVQSDDRQQEFQHLIRFEAVGNVDVKGNTISTNIPVVYQQSDHQNDFVAAHETVIEEPCDDYGDEYHDAPPDEDPDPDYILPHEHEEKKVQVTRTVDRVLRERKKSYKNKTTSCKSQKSVTAKRPRVTITQKSKCNDNKVTVAVKRKRIRKYRYKPKPRPEGAKIRKAPLLTPSYKDKDGREFIDKYEIIFLPEKEGYKCGDCGMTSTENGSHKRNRQKLLDHIRGIHLRLFKCPDCGKMFNTSALKDCHVRRYHTIGQVECDICGKPLQLVDSLPFHKWLHMNKEEQEAARAAGKMPKRAICIEKDKQSSYICRFCGKVLRRSSYLKQHERTHTESRENLVCPTCKKSFSSLKTLAEHRKKYCDSERPEQKMKWKKFPCSKCDKRYRSQPELNAHAICHLPKEDIPYACSICAKKFTRPRNWKEHEKAHAPGETPEDFPCPCTVCGHRFRTRRSVLDHLRKLHPETKKEIMEQNRLTNTIIPELVNELLLQDKDKSEKDCEEQIEEFPPYVENDNRELTYRNIKLTKIDKGYTCGFCSKDYCDLEYPDLKIKTHINAHHFGMYKCDICQNYCSSKIALKRHKLTHSEKTNVKTACCSTCGRITTIRNLVFHEWTHMTEEQKEALIASGDHSKVPIHVRKQRNLKTDKGKIKTSCKYCNETFPMRKEWRVHCKSNHPREWRELKSTRKSRVYNSSEDDNEDEEESKMSDNSDSEVEDDFESEERPTVTTDSLKEHSASLQKPESCLKCSICLKALRNKEHLDKHTAKAHTEWETIADYPIICAICGQRCKSKSSCILHHRKKHKGKSYKGGRINEKWLQPELLEQGVKNKGEEYPPFIKNDDDDLTYRDIKITKISGGYNCGFCGADVRRKDNAERSIRLHINGVHFGFYRCEICGKYFPDKGGLCHHRQDEHIIDKIPCKVCKKLFRPRFLKFHEWVHLTEKDKEAIIASGDYSKVPKHVRKQKNLKIDKSKIKTSCKYCNETFSMRKEWRVHCQKYHPHEWREQQSTRKRRVSNSSEDDNEDEEESKMSDNSDSEVEDDFESEERPTVTTDSLKEHSASLQKPESSLKCSICLKPLRNKERLDKHIAKAHAGWETIADYPIICAICGQRCKSKSSRTLHHRKNHKGKSYKGGSINEKRLQPELVEQGVKDKGEEYPPFLKNDNGDLTYRDIKITRISGGYNCGFCGADVRGKEYVERIIKSHINGVHFGFYRCEVCGKYLKTKHRLCQHRKDQHIKIPCKVCKKLFRPRNVKAHEWVHLSQTEKEAVIASGDYSKVPIHVRKQRNLKLAMAKRNKKQRVIRTRDPKSIETSESEQSYMSNDNESDSETGSKIDVVHFKNTSTRTRTVVKPKRFGMCEEEAKPVQKKKDSGERYPQKSTRRRSTPKKRIAICSRDSESEKSESGKSSMSYESELDPDFDPGFKMGSVNLKTTPIKHSAKSKRFEEWNKDKADAELFQKKTNPGDTGEPYLQQCTRRRSKTKKRRIIYSDESESEKAESGQSSMSHEIEPVPESKSRFKMESFHLRSTPLKHSVKSKRCEEYSEDEAELVEKDKDPGQRYLQQRTRRRSKDKRRRIICRDDSESEKSESGQSSVLYDPDSDSDFKTESVHLKTTPVKHTTKSKPLEENSEDEAELVQTEKVHGQSYLQQCTQRRSNAKKRKVIYSDESESEKSESGQSSISYEIVPDPDSDSDFKIESVHLKTTPVKHSTKSKPFEENNEDEAELAQTETAHGQPGQSYLQQCRQRRSNAKKRKVIYSDESESEKSESGQSSISYEIFPDPDSDSDFKIESVHLKTTPVKHSAKSKPFEENNEDKAELVQKEKDLSVNIIRLPESVLRGNDFKLSGDFVTYTWNGRTRTFPILDQENSGNESDLIKMEIKQEIYPETGYFVAEESFSDNLEISNSEEDSD